MRLRSASVSVAGSLALLLLAACSTVEIVDDDGGTVGPEPGPQPEPQCSPDPADVVDLIAVASGSFIGGKLHVEGRIDGRETYAVLDLRGDGVAELAELRDDLLGGASWTPTTPGYHVRRRGTGLDVLRTTGEASSIVATPDLGGLPTAGMEGLAFADGHLFACVDAPGDAPDMLTSFDVSDPKNPVLVGTVEECTWLVPLATVRGSLWVSWDPITVRLFDLATGFSDIHGWNPDGVHAYGELTAVKTDGAVVATTLENAAYSFFYYPNEQQYFVYTSLGPGEKQLLDVVDGVAVVAVADENDVSVIGFEVREPPAFETPAARATLDVVLGGASSELEGLALVGSVDRRLVLSDGVHLYDVPLDATGSVEPLLVVRQGGADDCVD
jgi:hypothetical protein